MQGRPKVPDQSLCVLTIRKIRVASGDLASARRAAEYTLERADSPQAFACSEHRAASAGFDAGGRRGNAVWLGSPRMLEQLGIRRGAEVLAQQLALALQGRSASSGEQVRRQGWIHRDAVDQQGRPLRDAAGQRCKERVLGTKCVDLTFSAPKSVSVVWSQARPEVRAEIEPAMLAAAAAMVEHMTQTKPVVSQARSLQPASGFAAAAALHVTARTAQGERVSWPQLHVHGVVVGVERPDGFFASPELSGMFKHGAPLEGGAVARAKLAELLVEVGFEIDAGTGRGGRFFEIRGVPRGLVALMSARGREVAASVKEREAAKGKALTNGERAVIALQTRRPKSEEAPAEHAVAAWREHAEQFGFGPAQVDALRHGSRLSGGLEKRRAAVRAAALPRLGPRGPMLSRGEAAALVLECAAGRLRLSEAFALLDELKGADAWPAPEEVVRRAR